MSSFTLHRHLSIGIRLAVAINLLLLGVACAEKITVCSGDCNHTSIQRAIDAANPGDTIEVRSGIYLENLNITKQLTLKGVDTGNGKPIIDAGGNGNAVSLRAYGIDIEGFIVMNSSNTAGIEVISNNNTIRDNEVRKNGVGIDFELSSYNNLSGNIFTYNNDIGINIYGCVNNTIIGNNVSHNRAGLLLNWSNSSIIKDNNVSNNSDKGIFLDGSSNNILENNVMSANGDNFGVLEKYFKNEIATNNLVNGARIYYLMDKSDLIINSSSNAGTVYCINCYNITVENLVLSHNHYGIFFSNTSGSIVENNQVSKNFYGITLDLSSNNALKNNSMSANQYNFDVEDSQINDIDSSNLVDGKPIYYLISASHKIIDSSSDAGVVYCINCNNMTITGLKLKNNSKGIYFFDTFDSRIKNNSINNNQIGVSLIDSSNNSVTSNNVSYNNADGLDLQASNNNNIDRNNVSNNKEQGLLLELSTNNTIKGNNIGHNTQGINFQDSSNNIMEKNLLIGNKYSFAAYGLNDIGTSNLVDGKPIYYLVNVSNRVIDSYSNAGMVYCINCNNISIKNLTIANNSIGISLDNISDSRIENNHINDNKYGIHLNSSSNNVISNNSVIHNINGMALLNSGNNILKSNIMMDNFYNFEVDGFRNSQFKNVIDTSNLVDGKPIYYLVGNSSRVIDSYSNAGTVYCISCNNITVKELIITNNKIGIYFSNTTNSIIQKNKIMLNNYNSKNNMVLNNGTQHNSMQNNMMTSNTKQSNIMQNEDIVAGRIGILLYYSSNNTIANNNIGQSDDGIALWNSSKNSIIGNNASNIADASINLWGSSSNSILYNNITESHNCILLWYSSNNNLIKGNRVVSRHVDGIAFYKSGNNTAVSNVAEDNFNGIILEDSSNSTVTGNDVPENFNGVHIINSDRNTFKGNTAKKDIHGFVFTGSSNNTVTANSANWNHINGIALESSYNSTIVGNNVAGNSNGIALLVSSNNIVRGNNASSNYRYGMRLENSKDNSIIGNSANANTADGIVLSRSLNNELGDNKANGNRRYGIIFYRSNNNTLTGNNAKNNSIGLGIGNSSNNILRDNAFSGNIFNLGISGATFQDFYNDIDNSNTLDEKSIYYLINAENIILNSSLNAATVYCINCDKITIKDQVLTNNSYGIYSLNMTRSRIENNSIKHNWIGLQLYNSSNNSIDNNNINSNYIGIYDFNSNNTLRDNRIQGNQFNETHGKGFLSKNTTFKEDVVPEVILETLSVINYSPTHGGYSGEEPQGGVSGAQQSPIPKLQTSVGLGQKSESSGVSQNEAIQPQAGSSSGGSLDGGEKLSSQTSVISGADLEKVAQKAAGALVFNPPKAMQYDVEEYISARIGAKNTTNLFQGLLGKGEIQYRAIDVTINLTYVVTLNGDGFIIKPMRPDAQVLGENPAEWIWLVKPSEVGNHTLILNVDLQVEKPPFNSKYVNVTEWPVMVEVKAPSPQEQTENILNNLYLRITGFIAFLTSLFGLYFVIKKWKKGDSE